jgi:hypothetical protein
MRVVAEIPHPQFKISIFSWNAKYIIKIELSSFEQVFKIKETEIGGLDDVLKLVNEPFLEGVMKNFLSMRTSFHESYKTLI